MGFEARETILDAARRGDRRQRREVRVVAYDLSEPEVVGRFEKLGKRLRIIIDDSKEHGEADSGETPIREAARKDGRQGQREAPAHEEPPAQQDDHRRRPEDEEGRLRLHQPELARALRAGQQRPRRRGRRSRSTSRSPRSTTTSTTTRHLRRDRLGGAGRSRPEEHRRQGGVLTAFDRERAARAIGKDIERDHVLPVLLARVPFDHARRHQGGDQEGL